LLKKNNLEVMVFTGLKELDTLESHFFLVLKLKGLDIQQCVYALLTWDPTTGCSASTKASPWPPFCLPWDLAFDLCQSWTFIIAANPPDHVAFIVEFANLIIVESISVWFSIAMFS
jgi:hypothetical protein